MEDQKVRALMYSEGEGCCIRLLPGEPVFKDVTDVIQEFVSFPNTTYSAELGQHVTSRAITLRGCNVFALFFEDGSVYEIDRGWRLPDNDIYRQQAKDWITDQHRLQSLKKEKEKPSLTKGEVFLRKEGCDDTYEDFNYGHVCDLLNKAMSQYANAKLDEAAAQSRSMVYEIDGRNPVSGAGLVMRNFKACYATAKHDILKLKDPLA